MFVDFWRVFAANVVFSQFVDQMFMDFWTKKDEKNDVDFQNTTFFFLPGESLKTCTGAVFWALLTFLYFSEIDEKTVKK